MENNFLNEIENAKTQECCSLKERKNLLVHTFEEIIPFLRYGME
jgi:hypothetical protein